MIASKIKDTEKLKLLDRFNLIYNRLTLSLNSNLKEEELFDLYSKFIKDNSPSDNSYIVNIEGFVFQNEEDKTIDEKALEFLQSQINEKERQDGN